jgi:hypothetical protein
MKNATVEISLKFAVSVRQVKKYGLFLLTKKDTDEKQI